MAAPTASNRPTGLLLLGAAALPVLLAFALVDASVRRTFDTQSLVIPSLLLLAFLIAYLAQQRFTPATDPALLPLAFLLSGMGLAFITRLDPERAASQVTWLFISVAALVATLVVVRSLEVLARYKYTIMLAGILLLLLPAFIGTEINGAKLWIRFGGFGFQPGEIAKLLIILFLAAYLSENREVLSVSTHKVAGIWLPPLKQLGPLLLMWAISLLVLVFERDLGSSLLLFGIFLVMLYAATGRASYVLVGLVLFAIGGTIAYRLFGHVQDRIAIWLHPFADAAGRGYQLVQSLFALGAGGVLGTGIGNGLPGRIPFVETDFIFTAVAEELGLLGAVAILTCYLVLALRGLAVAVRARSDMAAMTAVGIVAAFALQTFVIVGGVTRLIPLTGVTLPFVSYGGSSLVSSFIAMGLLMRAGDSATGTAVELETSSGAGVLGRVALGRRLTGIAWFIALLIVALVINLTYLQVVAAPALAANPANTRDIAAEAFQERGAIVAADGTVLAYSEKAGRSEGKTRYQRVYPEQDLASNVVGYYSTRYGRAGIEAAENEVLSGKRAFASFGDVIDAASGRPPAGNDVVLTVDTEVQRAAQRVLSGQRGAVVAIDPRTGALLAMATSPGFDPGQIDKRWKQLSTSEESPLLDRSRLALYAPGSTFKIVTLTGALANDVATPESTYAGPGRLEIGNAPVTNFEGGSYGKIDLRSATERSVNTVFAQLAVEMGPEMLVSQADAFGFGKRPPLELPAKSSVMPDPEKMTTWETAWAGVGQPVGEGHVPGPQATALQMALVAAGIANNGVVMEPHVVDRITDPAGRTISKTAEGQFTVAADPATAATVRDIMIGVVKQGSGVRASIPGVTVAGKTGTAEVGRDLPTNAWFVGFAPAESPTVAVAVLVEGGGVGGRAAAPLAKEVLQSALDEQTNK